MRTLLLTFACTLGTGAVVAQQLEGYTLADALVSAVHPNGCSAQNVLGFPDTRTWVNMQSNSVMTGLFASTWPDELGNDLMLETSFHADNYTVRLILEGGGFSAAHSVVQQDWIRIQDVEWLYLFTDCSGGFGPSERHIVLLDFDAAFGLLPSQRVAGVEITFLPTGGVPDLAGAYIIEVEPCDSVLSLGPDTTLCAGAELLLDASLAFGEYLWQDNSTGPTYTVTTAGTYAVRVITPCDTLTDSITVSYAESLLLDLGPDTALCSGAELVLDATVADGTYRWQDGSTGPTYTVSSSGLYHVTVTTSCEVRSDSITVYFTSDAVLELGNDTALCVGDQLVLDATNTAASYSWQDGSTNSTYTVTEAGLYRVSVQNPCGTYTDSIAVDYAPRPPLDLGDDRSLCTGDTILLDVSTDMATYRWQDNSSAPTYSIVQGGTYWVALSLLGCTVRDTLEVAELPLPVVDLGPDRSICSAAVIVLDATSPDSDAYRWQDGSTDPTFTVPAASLYWVELSNDCGVASDSIRITEDPLLGFDLGPDPVLCDGGELLVDVTIPGASYLWQDGSTLPRYLITMAGQYSVEITLGVCFTADAFTATEADCGVALRMPNVFSPNNDGLNDQFVPLEMKSISSATLTVYDRWGLVVHSAALRNRSGWNGQGMPEGTYYWVVEYVDRYGTALRQHGYLTLLR
ncbi:MAG: gliding motility-associated C-terminal domain-containing protein [Flavobacteriales bacterium]